MFVESCSKCNTIRREGDPINCKVCNSGVQDSNFRFNFALQFQDQSTKVYALCENEQGEHILGMNLEEYLHLLEKDFEKL